MSLKYRKTNLVFVRPINLNTLGSYSLKFIKYNILFSLESPMIGL